MRVSISLMGRFHAFYLAHEPERQGHLRVQTGFTRADYGDKMMAHYRRVLAGPTGDN